MTKTMKNFWRDESGAIVSSELVLIATLLTLPLITGLVKVKNAINTSLDNYGTTISNLNQDVPELNINVKVEDPRNQPLEVWTPKDIDNGPQY